VGLWLLCRLAGAASKKLLTLVYGGASLVIAGGFLKASWKLLWVSTGVDHAWMSAGLFWCMGPGFILLAGAGIALVRADRGVRPGNAALLLPVLLALTGVLAAAAGMAPAKPLTLMMTIAGNLTLMTCLLALAVRRSLPLTSVFITANVIITFALAGMARIQEQTAALQWIEEFMNLAAQGAFALAVLMIWRHNTKETTNE